MVKICSFCCYYLKVVLYSGSRSAGLRLSRVLGEFSCFL